MTEEAVEQFYAALLDDDADALYDRAPCGYLSTTPDGLIVKVNQTFLTLTGYQRTDLVGRKTLAQLLTAGGRIYHETHYAPMLRMQGTAREIALDIVGADRRRVPVLVNSVLERGADGNPVVIRTAVFDATQRREYERELLRATERATALARTLQQTLIPPEPPRVPGLDVAAVYRPAGRGDEVGGDFYDVFQTAHDDWVVLLGDVSGKGAEAAVVTALARYTLRAAVVTSERPSEALTTLNEVLLRHETDRYCTVVLLRLRRLNGSWHVAAGAGGHPLPLLVRPGDDPAPVGEPGSLLGLLPEAAVADTELVLHPGEALLLFTDGVTEARQDDEFYGTERLVEAAARHAGTARTLTDGILADVMAFQGGNPRDDIAVLALQVPA